MNDSVLISKNLVWVSINKYIISINLIEDSISKTICSIYNIGIAGCSNITSSRRDWVKETILVIIVVGIDSVEYEPPAMAEPTNKKRAV